MHTLYWHDQPHALLEGCRRALRPGGHAIFLTYGRPASVVKTFGEVRGREGWGAALHALRWLVPTVLFETARDCKHRYYGESEFHATLEAAGFEVLEGHRSFLAGLSHIAWVRVPTQQGTRGESG